MHEAKISKYFIYKYISGAREFLPSYNFDVEQGVNYDSFTASHHAYWTNLAGDFVNADTVDIISKMAPFLRYEMSHVMTDLLYNQSDKEQWKVLAKERIELYKHFGSKHNIDISQGLNDLLKKENESFDKISAELFDKDDKRFKQVDCADELNNLIQNGLPEFKNPYLNFIYNFTREVDKINDPKLKNNTYQSLYSILNIHKNNSNLGHLIEQLNTKATFLSKIPRNTQKP